MGDIDGLFVNFLSEAFMVLLLLFRWLLKRADLLRDESSSVCNSLCKGTENSISTSWVLISGEKSLFVVFALVRVITDLMDTFRFEEFN